MASTFKHTPLSNPKTCMRLIYLSAPSQHEATTITTTTTTTPTTATSPLPSLNLTLVETPISTAPKYWALSYTWDNQPFTHPAVINSTHTILLTANCHDALTQLSSEPASRKQPIWVDAICIDQSSITEKNHQVGLMSSIYSSATRVIIWLGPGDAQGDKSVKELSRLSLLAKVSPKGASKVYLRRKKDLERTVIDQLPGDTAEGLRLLFTLFPAQPGVEPFDPFQRVLSTVWHTRLWTLQEVVLARKAVLRLGKAQVDWGKLVRVGDAVTAESADMGFTQYPGDSFSRVRVVSSLRTVLKSAKKGRPHQDLKHYKLPRGHPFGRLKGRAEAVGLASHFLLGCMLGASNLRDKAYGQYAILQKHGVSLPAPDYTKPVKVIYEETARAIINRTSSLELLYYISAQGAVPDLPSWVPDFSFVWFPWVPGYEFTCAAGNDEARGQYRFDQDGALFLNARLVDRIKRKSVTFKQLLRFVEGTMSAKSTIINYYRLQEMIRFAHEAADIKGDKLEALTMVILQEMALSNHPSKKRWKDLKNHVRIWAEAMMEYCNSKELFGVSEPGTYTLSVSEQESVDIIIAASEPKGGSSALKSTEKSSMDVSNRLESKGVAQIMGRMLTHLATYPASKSLSQAATTRFDMNSLFITDNGLLGVASHIVQEGDGIYLVPGMRLPVIIRKESSGPDGEDGYRLIACPFVHGMMKGELWDSAKAKGGLHLEELRIV